MKKFLTVMTVVILIIIQGCDFGAEASQAENAQTKVFKMNIDGQVQNVSLVKINNVWYVPFDILSNYSNCEFKIDEKNGTIVISPKAIASPNEESGETLPKYSEGQVRESFNSYVKSFLDKCIRDKNKYYNYLEANQGSKKTGWARIKFKVSGKYSTKVERTAAGSSRIMGTFIYHISISQNQVCNTKVLADKNNRYGNQETVTVKNTYVFQQGKWVFQSSMRYIEKYNRWFDNKYEYYMDGYTRN